MGLFDTIKKRNEAKNLGLTVEQYNEYLIAQSQGITINEYKRYLSVYLGKYTLEQYAQRLRLEEKGFSPQECDRYLTTLAGKIQIEDYSDFLEAERLGLTVEQYASYSSSLKPRMSAVDYVGFLNAQKIGITLGKYLQYLKSFRDEMTIEEYDIFLKAEEYGMDREHYSEYLEKYKDRFSVERYLEFDKSRSLGMTLEEYDLRIEAAKCGMSLEQYVNHKEAEKLQMTDEEYITFRDLEKANVITDGALVLPETLTNLPRNVFRQFSFSSILFPKTLTEIPDGVFQDCQGLVYLTIPSNIKKVGCEAFKDCENIETITIESGVEEIGDSAFEGCKKLRELFIPGTVKTFDNHAVHGCDSLEKLEFEFGVQTIDITDWVELTNLNAVLTPASAMIRHLSPYRKTDARYGIINPEYRHSITTESRINYISPDNYAEFGLDEHRDEIEYLEVNGDYVFLDLSGFSKLKTVNFSAKGSVRSVNNCPELKMLIFHDFLSDYPSGYVSSDEEREAKIINLKTLKPVRFNAPALKFLVVEDGALVIDLDHYDSSSLAWVHIPAYTSRLGLNTASISTIAIHGNCRVLSDTFADAENITKIRFDKDGRENSIYSNTSAESLLSAELPSCDLIEFCFSRNEFTAETMGVQRAVHRVLLPEDLSTIGDNAFEAWGLRSIQIPASIEKIGNNAFMDCKELEDVVFEGIPNAFGSDIFDGCDQLKSISIDNQTLSAHSFAEKYEAKPVAFNTSIESKVMDYNERFDGEIITEEKDPFMSKASDMASESKKRILVEIAKQFTIMLPANYMYSVDSEVIGENRALIAMLNDGKASFDSPYSATESITVLIGKKIVSSDEADAIAESIGLQTDSVFRKEPGLNIRYAVKERGESLTIYLALICTDSDSYPVQVFFNKPISDEAEQVVTELLRSVERISPPASDSVDETAVVSENLLPENMIDVDDSSRDSDEKAIRERRIASEIPAGVLYRPGYEPEKVRIRIERLFEKLDSAYPDKVIVGLHKNYKKWGETVTELYRQLGYPDGNSFLTAYGYTIGAVAAGRPSSDPMEVVNELKRRYANGAICTKMADLAAENPDLAPKFKNLSNKADQFFGMTLQKYFIREGILAGKTDNQCEEVFQTLKSRYSGAPYSGKLNDLKVENSDLDWNAISRYFSQSGSPDTFKTFLVKEGILADKDTSLEDKLAEITDELKKRYPAGKAFTGTFSKLKSDNKDLSLSSLNHWTMQLYKLSAQDFLIKQGIMEEPQSVEDKLTALTQTLKERYASGEKKAYTITDLREQNLDLPISAIGNWAKKVFGQNATEYLTEQGILSEYEWMASFRMQEENRKKEEERRKAEERTFEERLDLEMAMPIKAEYYEAPTYYVEEISISGDEAKEWEYKDTYWKREGELFIDDYIGDKKHIIVPAYINGRRVVGLGPACFSDCKAEVIEIPGTIKEIGGTNGYGNEHLKSVVIGEGVEKIGGSFLSAAKKLTDVRVSKSVKCTYYSYDMDIPFNGTPWFLNQEGCVMLGESVIGANGDSAILNIPIGAKRVCGNMRINMPNLRKVIISDTVTELCNQAFASYRAVNVREFVIPASLSTIGTNAFGRSKWIQEQNGKTIIVNNALYSIVSEESNVIIPDGIRSICGEVFKGNKALKTIRFPSTLKEIGNSAFAECSNLTSINLPEGFIRLGEACFYDCKKLSKAHIPDSLVEIGESSFKRCSTLTEFKLGKSAEIIGKEAFAGCDMLRAIQMDSGVKSILSEAFKGCSSLKSINLPDTLKEIGREAFSECVQLERIVIPKGVTTINASAFSNCKSLRSVSMHDGIAEISRSAFENCIELKEMALSAGIRKIENSAFSGCSALIEMIIPDGVEVINDNTFLNCSSLRKIVLPHTLRIIGKCAFRHCTSVESIRIPDRVDTVGDNAFEGCSALCEVTIRDGISNFGLDVFTNTPYMKRSFGDFVIMGNVLTKYLGADKDVVIPNNVTIIGENAFAEAQHVESITIPDTVKSIANKVFGEVQTWGDDPKPQLRKVIIGNGVTQIGEKAFANCELLSDVSFGKSLSAVGKEAFSGCHKLNAIDLSMTEIKDLGQEVFSGCWSVKKLVFPNGVERIGRGAFSGIALGVVKLPKTIKKVERSSFDGTTELIVYDSIDPDAKWANEWQHDKWNGTVNSALSCAMLRVPQLYVESQANTGWRDYHITVLSSDTETIRYRIFCDSEEREAYRAMMFSAWGKYASFSFDAYDEYFMKTRSQRGRTEMAFCRIQYPEGLSAAHRADYEAFLERCLYIERSARRTAEIIADDDAVERLQLLDEYHAIDAHNTKWLYEELDKKHARKCLAYLEQRYSR